MPILGLKKQIKDTKSQVFIVCPFIEDRKLCRPSKLPVKNLRICKKMFFKNLAWWRGRSQTRITAWKNEGERKDEVLEKSEPEKLTSWSYSCLRSE